MSLEPLTGPHEIQEAYATLHKQLTRNITPVNCNVGWKGESKKLTVYWRKENNMWVGFDDKLSPGRYWCPYGLHEDAPRNNEQLNIICEINPPKSGLDLGCAGLFVRDTLENKIFLCHSGKIGGGYPGVGKDAFWRNYIGVGEPVALKGKEFSVVVIGGIEDGNLWMLLAQFIREVARIKEKIRAHAGAEIEGMDLFPYNKEYVGKRRPYTVTDTVKSRCYQGIVTEAIMEECTKRHLTASNRKPYDLFVYKKQQMEIVFEIKTSTDTASVQQGVGQLMLYTANLPNQPRLVLVLPGDPGKDYTHALCNLKIDLLTYRWKNGTPVFRNLDDILRRY